LIVKWIVTVAAFVYLLNQGMFSSAHFSFSIDSAPWLLGTLACAFITVFGTAVRFHCVLLQLGQPSRLSSVVRMFFGGLLLRQIGSDLAFDGMRLVMLRKQGVEPAIIGTAVLTDRLFGVSTIFLIAFLFSFFYLKIENLYWLITLSLILLAAIPVFFIAFYRFYCTRDTGALFRIPGSKLALGMGEALELLSRKPVHMILLSLFSFLPFLATLFAAYCNSRILENMILSCGEAMAGASVAVLASILPLPLSGVGVGESVFGWVVSVIRGGGEIVNYAPVFFLSRLFMLTIGCVSWVVTMCSGKRRESLP
jgi:uncharacterized membrane protein (UPF0136 family)